MVLVGGDSLFIGHSPLIPSSIVQVSSGACVHLPSNCFVPLSPLSLLSCLHLFFQLSFRWLALTWLIFATELLLQSHSTLRQL